MQIATEFKMYILVIQNYLNNISPFVVVAYRPQSNDEMSDFTRDCCYIVKMISNKYSHINYTRLSTDYVLLETTNLIKSKLAFRMENTIILLVLIINKIYKLLISFCFRKEFNSYH